MIQTQKNDKTPHIDPDLASKFGPPNFSIKLGDGHCSKL